jgi:hypothetical protein
MKMESFENPTNPENKEEQMSKVTWTEKDVRIAKDFLKALATFDIKNGFNVNKNPAAKMLQYENYNSLPAGVKSYISHIGSETKKRKTIEKVVQNYEEDWGNAVKTDKNFAHGNLHPEDDADTIESFKQNA